ncbi:MAG: M48 family metallopeptidase [Verrucomicrobia bacterium]|nr:M48 family metallopeptidase [Verrucomicrobiota bacterium]
MRPALLAIIFLGLLLLSGCAVVPETGRSQLNILSPGEEMQLGLTSFEQLKKETPVSKDAKLNALVQRVGHRIAAVAPLPNAQWEFVLFDSKEANAFCLPGGKVGIYTGILPITQDEAGLSTVIGHEVAHAVARHGAERMSEAMLMQSVGAALNAGLTARGSKYHGAAMTVYGLGTSLGRALPHSRKQESEADQIGLLYMARAGYNPEAAVGFWQRFSSYNRQSGQAAPWFLRTHPLDEVRIRQLQEWMPRAKQEFRPAAN